MDENLNPSQNSEGSNTEPENVTNSQPEQQGEAFGQSTGQGSAVADGKTLAIIAHVGGIFVGFLAPLVIYLIQKDKDQFSYDHSKEALNFQITIAIAYAASMVLSFLAIGFLLMPLVILGNVVFSIMAAMAASNDKMYTYPVSIRLIK